RFSVLSAAARVVDAARVIDNLTVAEARAISPPRFSVEILRNDRGLSLIGLIPSSTNREAAISRLRGALPETEITDFLETANYSLPAGWTDALSYALAAVELLPNSKISVTASGVAVEAIAKSAEEKRRWEVRLQDRLPSGLSTEVDISAPRPVVTPFTLRFSITEEGAGFDACAADSEAAQARILAAAAQAGAQGAMDCTLALGTPSTTWGDATAMGIAALADLGQGNITFSDGDVTLVAAQGTDQARFDRITSKLEAELPELFSLTAVLPEPPDESDDGPPEFLVTLSPERMVQLRGVAPDELSRATLESFARAQFSASQVYSATRLAEQLPDRWALRSMAALEALGELHHGSVFVDPEEVRLRGVTAHEEGRRRVAQVLAARLGEGAAYAIDVRYDATLDPLAQLLNPPDCMAAIAALTDAAKITFEPGSTTLDTESQATVGQIAEVLEDCHPLEIEIGGHTDSQGREEMNQALSFDRANAVLNALLGERVVSAKFTARGYGESQPIADNGTEEGREANRRIVFSLTADGAEDDATKDEEAGTAADAPEESADE
ncbi:MAG: OmpA family protein, partial [Pseudomonadota bacterium]